MQVSELAHKKHSSLGHHADKVRRTLATSQYIVSHQGHRNDGSGSPPNRTITSAPCAHYFLDPLSWMRSELEQGKLDGRLECPKCNTNVGKYAWQGMQCSCGNWVVPGISLAKGRIDEVKSKPHDNYGIRMPPSTSTRKPGQGQGNL